MYICKRAAAKTEICTYIRIYLYPLPNKVLYLSIIIQVCGGEELFFWREAVTT
ncbi:hypothetical protein BGX38DRAFT_1182744 [Terfezia claveryi]|nr:hypothetical protein BGX38DRAFT_1182744 [Terfezia claveryi]